MFQSILAWLGFAQPTAAHGHGHHHGGALGSGPGHGHTHGTIDPTIATTTRGIWAIKWSFVILAITAVFQLGIVLASGSVALLADTIHNIGDAVTAVPLWVAFTLARRKPNPRFTYGYGRVEDLAGVVIVLIILSSAIIAGYEAIDRLLHPQTIAWLGWVVVAGLVGFVGNEAVAIFRIRVGRQINSAALIADGYHARTDGFTSLAVVAGATGVWLGFPLADPIVGLLITLAIFGIVWQSAKAVLTRLLDGVEPSLTAEIRHAAEHIPNIRQVLGVRARWLGHQLHADLDVALNGTATLREAEVVTAQFERELFGHIPVLSAARIRVRPYDPRMQSSQLVDQDDRERLSVRHHHAPTPVPVGGQIADGVVEIVDTAEGERLRFTASRLVPELQVLVTIQRDKGRVETLVLVAHASDPDRFSSIEAPGEPHEFDAQLHLRVGDRSEALPFRMVEPESHPGAHGVSGHEH